MTVKELIEALQALGDEYENIEMGIWHTDHVITLKRIGQITFHQRILLIGEKQP